MTVDTSREAVRIFIAAMRALAKTDSPEHLTLWQSAYTLAALLNERDELRQALFECYQVSGADTDGADAREMAESWELYPRLVVEAVRELRQKADDDTEYDAQQQRIRDLEAEVARKVHVIRHLERERIAEAGRAERAEAERDEAVKERVRLETQKDILWAGLNDAKVHIERVEAERDRLAVKLDAVKRYVKRVPFPKADKMLAILADTDEDRAAQDQRDRVQAIRALLADEGSSK